MITNGLLNDSLCHYVTYKATNNDFRILPICNGSVPLTRHFAHQPATALPCSWQSLPASEGRPTASTVQAKLLRLVKVSSDDLDRFKIWKIRQLLKSLDRFGLFVNHTTSHGAKPQLFVGLGQKAYWLNRIEPLKIYPSSRISWLCPSHVHQLVIRCISLQQTRSKHCHIDDSKVSHSWQNRQKLFVLGFLCMSILWEFLRYRTSKTHSVLGWNSGWLDFRPICSFE